MAKKDIRHYSAAELKEMAVRNDYTPTRQTAPTIELEEDFWRHARLVVPEGTGKSLVSFRVDNDVLAWFKAKGTGHLSRMNAVLHASMEGQRAHRPVR